MDDRSSEIEIELGAEKAREEPSERKVGRQARSDASRSSRSRSDRLGRTHAGSDAEQLADELGRTRLRTTDDGYVEARVTALERVSAETVRLVVSLPTGESVAFRLEKPVPWSEEFLLARLVRDAGYDAATVDHLVGERVYLARGDPIEEDGVWAEGTGTVPDTYRGVAAAIGLGDFVDTGPRWRLVDPAERTTDSVAGRRLSLPQRLLAITAGFAGTLLALAVLSATTAIGAGATAALSALLFVVYVGAVSTLFVRALRSG